MAIIFVILLSVLYISCVHSIFDGIPISIHFAPFAVQLMGMDDYANWISAGSGVLVHPRMVLTSTYCKKFSLMAAFAGTSYTHNSTLGAIKVTDGRFTHPKFDGYNYAFCLLKLSKEFELSPSLQVAALASMEQASKTERMLISGWGNRVPNSPDARPEILATMITVCESCVPATGGGDWITIRGATSRYNRLGNPTDSGAPYYSYESGIVYGIVTYDVTVPEHDENNLAPHKISLVWFAKDWIRKMIVEHAD